MATERDKVCIVEGCDTAGLLRGGLCNKHYQRMRKRGTTDDYAPLRNPTGSWQLTDTDKAYIAGFLDGEGTIGMRRVKRPQYKGGYSYEPYVSAGNTAPDNIELLHRVFGGAFRQRKQPDRGNNKIEFFQWDARCKTAVAVCEAIVPFLRMKRAQAEILVTELKVRHVAGGRRSYDEDYWQRLESIYFALKAMNLRGRGPQAGET